MKTIITEQIFTDEYNKQSPQILSYLIRALNGNEAEAQDILQEAFMRAWKSRDKFKGNCSIKSWLFTIAINLFREKIRRKKLIKYTDEVPEVECSDDANNHRDNAALITERVSAALEDLPVDQQQVFDLIRNKGMSYKEAAESLGSSVSTVRMCLHRANKALAVALEDLKDLV